MLIRFFCFVFLFVGMRLSAEVPSIAALSVGQLIGQLDDDDFRVREAATLELAKHAGEASSTLLHLIESRDKTPEVTRRSLRILIDAAGSTDKANSEAAVEALRMLAASGDSDLSALANNSLVDFRRKRRAAQIQEVVDLGGKVSLSGGGFRGSVVYTSYVTDAAPVRALSDDLVKRFDALLSKERIVSKRAEAIAEELTSELVAKDDLAAFNEAKEYSIVLGTPTLIPSPVAFPTTALPSPVSAAMWETAQSLHVVVDRTWKGGDDGIKRIASIENVVSLNLNDAEMSSVAVRHIVAMPQLKSVQIYKSNIESAALRVLRKLRPDIGVFATGDGYLGVNGGDGPPEGFLVTGVTNGGGAEKAGIKAGDIITKLNDIPIKDLADVSLFVFAQKAGYPFRAEVIRTGNKVTFEGKLGSRADVR